MFFNVCLIFLLAMQFHFLIILKLLGDFYDIIYKSSFFNHFIHLLIGI